jgi:dipeptidase
MKRILRFQVLLYLCISIISLATSAQIPPAVPDQDETNHTGSCTSIMAGRLASTDGSVITSHTCDGPYRTWVEIFPHMKYEKGTIHQVYTGVLNPAEASWDLRNVRKTGEIPEAEETFSFLNTAYPCMNEKQLAIGETTISGRKELRNADGIFYIEELEKIALQRCTKAREAIALIGRLAEQYGYGDWAECITIADTKEVWQFEISGSGKGKPSAIWCAARIPDDQAGVSANVPRISTVDFNNRDMFMFSTDLRKVAKDLGYWDGKEPFKFWKVISAYGKAYGTRELFILKTLDPSLKISADSTEIPFTVRPEKKLSTRDVIAFFRQTYERTQLDMSRNLLVNEKHRNDNGDLVTERVISPVASNWMGSDLRNLLNELRPGTVEFKYCIAQDWCSYSQVIQCRGWLPDEVGAVAWFSFDNPAMSPRIPIFSGVLNLPECFGYCGQERYNPEAAVWKFRETNRLAEISWGRGRKIIEPAVQEFEDKGFGELPMIEDKVTVLVKQGKNEDARRLVTDYTDDFANSAIRRWEELKGKIWAMYSMGF